MARSMRNYLDMLSDDVLEHVVRHLSDAPHHPKWDRFFPVAQFFTLAEAGGSIGRAAVRTFNGLTTKRQNVYDFDDEDGRYKRLVFNRLADAVELPRYIALMDLRSLVLQRVYTNKWLCIGLVFPYCASTVKDLELVGFGDGNEVSITAVLKHLGPNLTSFSAYNPPLCLLVALERYCVYGLDTLKLTRLDHRRNLSRVGDAAYTWENFRYRLKALTLHYWNDCQPADGALVSAKFPVLRELNVTCGNRTAYLCEKSLGFYEGIGRHFLESARVGTMYPSLLAHLRSNNPSMRLFIDLTRDHGLLQLQAAGERLVGVNVVLRNTCSILYNPILQWNALPHGCLLEELKIANASLQPIVNTVMMLLTSDLRNLRKLQIRKMHANMLDHVSRITGKLEVLELKGININVQTVRDIARANIHLKKVSLELVIVNHHHIMGFLEAFQDCRELRYLCIEQSRSYEVHGDLNELFSNHPGFGRFRLRNAYVEVQRTVLQA